MAYIQDIIKRELNPFDSITIKPMNFWREKQQFALTVNSIHQQEINELEGILDLVDRDHRSRTVLLIGDSGSGKTHLLGRLKDNFNSKAFFAHILCNWADSEYIWRHTLRSTVDSLIKIPDGQQDSQLILWLKSLSAFTKRNLKERLFNDGIWNLLQSDRQSFIKHLKQTYKQAGIYNPDIFFGLLHDLTNPDLYDLACEWLQGNDLSEESMQILKVKSCIDTEDAAKNILSNFGKISTDTQPIVLCFDNLETLPKLTDGHLDIQPLFDVNTTIHGDYLKNFLVIISVVTNTWQRHVDRIQQSDKASIKGIIRLKPITLEQAEAIWAYSLSSLHGKANPKPDSPIFPLNRQLLEQNFPGGKTMPRNTINLGNIEYQKYKLSLLKTKLTVLINQPQTGAKQKYNSEQPVQVNIPVSSSPPPIPDSEKILAEFQIIWEQEYKRVQAKISKISLLSSPDLIRMLQESLAALQIQEIRLKLLSGRYASYSLSYQQIANGERIGIVWTEDSQMVGFFNIMNACHKVIQQNICKTLYLIRIGGVGTPKLAGNQIYQQIFTHTNHHHLKPNLTAVHYLATYRNLVNSALSQELVVNGKTIVLAELQSLIRESKILHRCALLQDLGIVAKQQSEPKNGNEKLDLRPVKEFLLNLVKTQGYMGVNTLMTNSADQFPTVKETDVQLLIELLCQEKKVKLINPKAKLQEQLICLIA
jgi:GTPase SAR1 family protein